MLRGLLEGYSGGGALLAEDHVFFKSWFRFVSHPIVHLYSQWPAVRIELQGKWSPPCVASYLKQGSSYENA